VRQRKTENDGASAAQWIGPGPSATSAMLGYFDRVDDIRQIQDAIIARYGTGIRITKDPTTGVSYESYTKTAFAEKVYNGSIEAIPVGFGLKVASALATLFSAQTARFSLSVEEGGSEDAVAKATRYLNKHRRAGRFSAALVRADMLSVEMASSVVLVEYVSGSLKYSAFDAGSLQVLYYPEILEDGRPRAARLDELDDAVAIVLRTGRFDSTRDSYLAVYGACELYPNGRYCTYHATSADSTDVPFFGAEGCYDYEDPGGGGPANPLTLYAQDHPDQQIPEYPVVILYGGQTMGPLLPVSDSLYRASLDADVAASHTRSTSQDAARGTSVISRDITAKAAVLPRSLVGNVDLAPGLTFEHMSLEAEESQIAWNVASNQMTHAAGSWSVPDYQMGPPEKSFATDASGVNLEIKTRPLNKAVWLRRELNAPAVDRLFRLERAYLDLYDAEDADITVLLGCEQVWDFIEIKPPVDPIQNSARVVSLLDKGVFDIIEAIRAEFGYDTDEDAVAQYERMKARKEKYPPLKEPELPPGIPGQPPGKGDPDDPKNRYTGRDRRSG
jgi:hypothetical protein